MSKPKNKSVVTRIREWMTKRSVTVMGDDLLHSWKESTPFSGVKVTEDTALNFSAVFAAHKIISESTAMLPLFLLRRLSRGKEQARDHSLFGILHDIANPDMDAYLVRETLTSHLVGWGRAHAKLDYDADGRITAMWPIPPSMVTQRYNERGALVFDVQMPSGEKKTYRRDEMLFLRGMSPDGVTCYSPIRMAKEGIGLALAAEAYGATVFGNGSVPGGILEHPGELDETAYGRIRENWNDSHGGISNANRIAILEEGMKYNKIGISPDDAQFLTTRAFQVQEIGRWYRIPSMMLNLDGANSTYASVEAFGLQFVMYTLYPWLVRWEKSISMQMLLPRERKELFAEHSITALLRGDTASRFNAYAIGRQWGWLSVNEIREFENMNPIENGDSYLTPLNMVESGQPNPKTQRAFLPILSESVARVFKREASDIASEGKKIYTKRGAEGFADWLSAFYQEQQDFTVRTLETAANSYASTVAENNGERVEQSLRLFALRHATQAQEAIKRAMQTPEPLQAIESICNDWNAERSAKLLISNLTATLMLKEHEWTN